MNRIISIIIVCLILLSAAELSFSLNIEFGRMQRKPYLLMVTAMDQNISSTPLLDVRKETIELMNNSPYDAFALNIVDMYSAQPLPAEKTLLNKADLLKATCKKDVWVRVNMSRIYQRGKQDVEYYYREGWKLEDLAKLPPKGVPVNRVREMSTPYFSRIKLVDIYDEAGSLSDFYKIWKMALKFGSLMNSGIVLDPEGYTKLNTEKVSSIAKAHGISTGEVIERLKEIGTQLANIAGKEYPQVRVLVMQILIGQQSLNKGELTPIAYIIEGMMSSAIRKKMPLRIIEGGENDIKYINRDLKTLKHSISQRLIRYQLWLNRFPDIFSLGGTITLWDDPSKISGWVKRDAGTNNPFNSLADFKPFLKELFFHYKHIWLYVPMVVDYKPYDPMNAPIFHRKLQEILNEVYDEILY